MLRSLSTIRSKLSSFFVTKTPFSSNSFLFSYFLSFFFSSFFSNFLFKSLAILSLSLCFTLSNNSELNVSIFFLGIVFSNSFSSPSTFSFFIFFFSRLSFEIFFFSDFELVKLFSLRVSNFLREDLFSFLYSIFRTGLSNIDFFGFEREFKNCSSSWAI